MVGGQMDASIGCLVNSISRFIHLVLCQRIKSHHLQLGYRKIAEVLKLLKSVLDVVVELRIPPNDTLQKECEELDVIVNEAREILERWSLGMSKICGVSQVDSFLMRIQGSSIEICKILRSSSSYTPAISGLVNIENCLQEFRDIKQERIAECIGEALSDQRRVPPRNETILEIADSLNLRLGEELFRETIAVEKERLSDVKEVKGDIDQIARLVTYMRDFMIQTNYFQGEGSKRIPPYFRCPLSSVLMLDPVIVASGQTYERAAIQKWLDQGLSICPKTRLPLTHLNFITNYTVKDMVKSWWDQNNVGHTGSSEVLDPVIVDSPINHVSPRKLENAEILNGSPGGGGSNSKPLIDFEGRCKGKECDFSLVLSQEEYNEGDFGEIETFEALLALEESYSDSRSASTCSARSSVDYVSGLSDHIPSLLGSSHRHGAFSYHPLHDQSGGGIAGAAQSRGSGDCNSSEAEPFLSTDPAFDESTTGSYVEKLVGDLKSQSRDLQTKAAAELRLLAKNNPQNRAVIGQCGAIALLVSLLYSPAKWAQEHAVTALLNLSLNEENKIMIVDAGAIEPLLYVLKSGNEGARENAAATFFSLSSLDKYKSKIGRSGAIKGLVNLLGTGSPRGKKDAASALFSLSIFHENKARIIQAGAVKHLVGLIDPVSSMVDKSMAILANLSTIGEGCAAIVKEGGVPLLVEVVESGSQRGKENAASVLLQLCLSNPKFCTLVLQEGAVPPLVALSQSGTPRAKEKARQLLSHFRNQREGAIAKTKQ